jgi:hypothetical protein
MEQCKRDFSYDIFCFWEGHMIGSDGIEIRKM